MIYQTKKLGEVLDYEQPGKYIVKSKNYSKDYITPVLTAGKTFILGYTEEKNGIFPTNKLPVIIFDDFTTATKFVDFPFKVKSSAMKILHAKKEKADIQYLFYLLQTIELNHFTHKRYWISEYSNLEIPLPPLSEQKKIVKILDEKMGKIAEAKKIREEALADTEKILSQTLQEIFEEGKKKGWEDKTIGDIFNYGKGLSKFERSPNGKYIAYGANGELGKTDKFLIDGESIIIGRKGSAGEVIKASGRFWPTDVTYFVTEDKKYNVDFAFYLFKYLDFTQYAKGVKPGINRNEIYSLKFYFPSLSEQQKIVEKLDKLSIKIRQAIELQKLQLEDFKKLEKSYLREAFNGELV